MTRQTAYNILSRYITNPVLLKHSLAVEAVMRSFAPRFNGDVEEWGITGLLHDADYEKAKNHPEKHGLLLSKLEPNSIPSIIERAIQSHNFSETHIMPNSPMEWVLVCCDELTGIIFELANKNKDKMISSLNANQILDALAKNKFPKEITKNIYLCEEKLQIPLKDFIAITLSAVQTIPKPEN